LQSNRNIFFLKKICHCHCYQEDGLAAKQEESYLKKSVIAHCYQEDGIAAKQQEFYLKKISLFASYKYTAVCTINNLSLLQ